MPTGKLHYVDAYSSIAVMEGKPSAVEATFRTVWMVTRVQPLGGDDRNSIMSWTISEWPTRSIDFSIVEW
jgi:hypothetical protein